MEVLRSQNFTDHSCAFKGKRTKRSRPSSPLDIAGMTTVVVSTTTTSSSIAGGSNTVDDDGRGRGRGRDRDGGDFYDSTIRYSPTTSTTQISTTYSNTSEEDEDMANCLILLAQSGSQVVTEFKKKEKMITGKSGFYVYECKTCNKTFPSFQALGGHRASHKKPKTTLEDKKVVTVTATTTTALQQQQHDDEEIDGEQGRLNKISSSSTSTQLLINNNKSKIHECSICGSEFSSGQALGGHMRRHRPPTTTTTRSLNVVSESSSSHHEDEKTRRNLLSLDLNLPAQPEEDQDDHKFEQSLVFPSTPLVDCYY